MIDFSFLDLAPVVEGSTPAISLKNSVELARHAERLGYRRFWLAEHHNMPGIASAATAVVIAHIAAGTKTIRVGAGGIMLPNHAPLIIAEQFGTLEALYPNRIDLGLGRAPGTDMITARALRRDLATSAEAFPQDVQELQYYFSPAAPDQKIQAVPGAGSNIPLWILGSSLFGAQLAAALGLPYAFASHFAPAEMMNALALYRHHFKPSASLDRPHAMVTVNIVAADTDHEANYHFTSQQQAFVNLRRGKTGLLPPPIDDINSYWSDAERPGVEHALSCSFVGTEKTVRDKLEVFLEQTKPDELMITNHIFHQEARLHSLALTASIRDSLKS